MSEVSHESLFILDDELCVEDEARECVDAYLCATDGLVDRLKARLISNLSVEQLESMNNINFYGCWNLKTDSVDLMSTFWCLTDGKETHHAVQIYLTDIEAKGLTSAMNEYCRKRYGENCLGFVNEARSHEGLSIIEDFSNHYLYNGILFPNTLQSGDKNKALSLDDRIKGAFAETHAAQVSNEKSDISWER